MTVPLSGNRHPSIGEEVMLEMFLWKSPQFVFLVDLNWVSTLPLVKRLSGHGTGLGCCLLFVLSPLCGTHPPVFNQCLPVGHRKEGGWRETGVCVHACACAWDKLCSFPLGFVEWDAGPDTKPAWIPSLEDTAEVAPIPAIQHRTCMCSWAIVWPAGSLSYPPVASDPKADLVLQLGQPKGIDLTFPCSLTHLGEIHTALGSDWNFMAILGNLRCSHIRWNNKWVLKGAPI